MSDQPGNDEQFDSLTKPASEAEKPTNQQVAYPINHGEPDPQVEAQRQAALDALKDPWGTTPMQMRDTHDDAVDPANLEPADLSAGGNVTPDLVAEPTRDVGLSGADGSSALDTQHPEATEEVPEEQQSPTGGTLPGV